MSKPSKSDGRRRKHFLGLAGLVLFVGLSTASFGATPNTHISQYRHTAWRIEDGYFGGRVWAITQTKDGYIWVGTEAGLYKFDGVNFVRWRAQSGEELPSSRIFALRAARDGSLWIGTEAGLARLVSNRLVVDHRNDGWVVWKIFEDKEGKIWVTRNRPNDATHALCQVLDNEVRCEENPDVFLGVLAQDAAGDLWIGGSTTLMRRGQRTSRVYQPQSLRSNSGNEGVSAILPASDGSLWVGMELAGRGAGLQRLVNGTLKPFLAPELNGETLAVISLCGDHQDNVWVGTITKGLYRIHGMDVDHYGSESGLSGDSVDKVFEDREGNLWVATSQGLDTLREVRVKTISKREGLYEDQVQSVAASRDGSVWIGTERLQVLGAQGISLAPGKALPGDQITSIFEDQAGRLWVGATDKLFVRERVSFRQITRQDGSVLGWATGITEDSEHNIWVETGRPPGPVRSLVQIQDLKVKREFPATEMPEARRVVADPQSGIWLGLLTGDLARYRDGQVKTFTFGDHPNSRVLAIIAAADGSILGGTDFGVVGWRNGKQQVLTERNGLPCNSVPALNSDDAGNLWLYAQCGLIEISKEEMQAWWDHPDRKLNLLVLDSSDGVRPGVASYTSSAKTPDGRLWFANSSVLQVIDPARATENRMVPPVNISALVADQKTYPLELAIHLPPLTRDLEIDYTALSYVVPQKVRFRYRLEGHDDDWQEPGTRRQAFYNDLPPRRYRFRVIACNNDGVWNTEGASIDFFLLPAYYQTNWFLLLCFLTGTLLMWALYHLRVRQIARILSVRFDERLAERTRMARELHDTFLQTIQGSKLVAEHALKSSDDRVRMVRALEQLADWLGRATEEGRAALNSLRISTTQRNDLAEALKRATEESRTQSPMEVSFSVVGDAREMHPTVRDEVYRIGYEAIRNACAHSRARRLNVALSYARDLSLRVSDDGVGIDPSIADRGRDGHFGLQGMRERAARIGGKLTVVSSANSGTEITVVVPAGIVFKNSNTSPFERLHSVLKRMSGTPNSH